MKTTAGKTTPHKDGESISSAQNHINVEIKDNYITNFFIFIENVKEFVKSLGGNYVDYPSNLVIPCPKCSREKHENYIKLYISKSEPYLFHCFRCSTKGNYFNFFDRVIRDYIQSNNEHIHNSTQNHSPANTLIGNIGLKTHIDVQVTSSQTTLSQNQHQNKYQLEFNLPIFEVYEGWVLKPIHRNTYGLAMKIIPKIVEILNKVWKEYTPNNTIQPLSVKVEIKFGKIIFAGAGEEFNGESGHVVDLDFTQTIIRALEEFYLPAFEYKTKLLLPNLIEEIVPKIVEEGLSPDTKELIHIKSKSINDGIKSIKTTNWNVKLQSGYLNHLVQRNIVEHYFNKLLDFSGDLTLDITELFPNTNTNINNSGGGFSSFDQINQIERIDRINRRIERIQTKLNFIERLFFTGYRKTKKFVLDFDSFLWGDSGDDLDKTQNQTQTQTQIQTIVKIVKEIGEKYLTNPSPELIWVGINRLIHHYLLPNMFLILLTHVKELTLSTLSNLSFQPNQEFGLTPALSDQLGGNWLEPEPEPTELLEKILLFTTLLKRDFYTYLKVGGGNGSEDVNRLVKLLLSINPDTTSAPELTERLNQIIHSETLSLYNSIIQFYSNTYSQVFPTQLAELITNFFITNYSPLSPTHGLRKGVRFYIHFSTQIQQILNTLNRTDRVGRKEAGLEIEKITQYLFRKYLTNFLFSL